RPVKRENVHVGDIAIFHAGKPVRGGEGGIIMEKGDIIHSALVIRVTGTEVELLDKAGPELPMTTRTVDEVLAKYRKDEPYVKFLAPTLKGMTLVSPSSIGTSPPSRKVADAAGMAAEDTHILFEAGSTVSLPHEDLKLLALIARIQGPVELAVHGYS